MKHRVLLRLPIIARWATGAAPAQTGTGPVNNLGLSQGETDMTSLNNNENSNPEDEMPAGGPHQGGYPNPLGLGKMNQ
jgi:hypothetical protein